MKYARLLSLLVISSTSIIAAPAATKPSLPAGISLPADFDVTLFAHPPQVNYPTCLTATPRGEVFVGIDEQGSLGREANRGRIVRCIDTDHDGIADQINTFASMDHPRGLVWDDATHALYVLHPPTLTRYDDDNNDGVSDRSTVIVSGIGNPGVQTGRGADHTTNGIRLGIDGWIYIAMGDFGCPDAVGADGTHVQHHGGGIIRVRTDGTGLEKFISGTRNIYDVAIDPLMNVFTRDNTNDGDGWNDRLAYDVPGGYYGYPSRFRNFPGEYIDCLIDFGGGSPCGVIFLDEPGFPPNLGHGFYTVEWGRNVVDRHPLTPDGAGFNATTEKLMDLPRGTDIDVDGASNLYLSSWANGGFDYSGPNVGFVLRLSPKGYSAPAFPDLAKASDADLLKHLSAPSGVLRQATQREILHRGDKPVFVDGLTHLVESDAPLASRVLAIFTLKLLSGDAANQTLASLCTKPELREFALHALADRKADDKVEIDPFLARLRDTDPRVRLIAAWGLGRLNNTAAAEQILPLTNDTDPLVAHVAVNSIVSLKAIEPALNHLSPGALNALQQLHELSVVEGLAKALEQTQDTSLHAQILRALCRLYSKEGDWDGSWWGTRPDTAGPYFKAVDWSGTPRVREIILRALQTEAQPIVRTLLLDCAANRIDLPEVNDLLGKIAATDPSFRGVMLAAWDGHTGFSDDQIAEIRTIAQKSEDPALHAKAIHVLNNDAGNAHAIETIVPLLAPTVEQEKPDATLAAEIDAFIQHDEGGKRLETLKQIATKTSTPLAERELTFAAIIQIGRGEKKRKVPGKIVAKAWEDPAAVVPLLRAIARIKADGYEEEIRTRLSAKDPAIAQAAAHASAQLGLNRPATQPSDTISVLGFDQTVARALAIPGDANLGKDVFKSQGCMNCHTVTPDQPPKGPYLGGISTRYKRAELCESVLKPSAKIAQGFETQWFKTKDDIFEGFVTRESGDEVEFRTITGATTVLKKADIKSRGKRDISVMPEGLVAKLSPKDMANLMAYLESLKAK